MPVPAAEARCRSGIAARLAGVPVTTLRVWERRYRIVGPPVSAGHHRLYSKADIRRLALIKQLVDLGHPIGPIAGLDDAALDALRGETQRLPGAVAIRPRLALVGSRQLTEKLGADLGGRGFAIAARLDPHAAAGGLEGCRATLLVVEFASLHEAGATRTLELLRASGAPRALVLYRFAASAVIRRLRAAGHRVAHATADVLELEALCLAATDVAEAAPVARPAVPAARSPPPPRFDEAALAQLAGSSRSVECECPAHLVELVTSLAAFERYSADCRAQSPADAALHATLAQAAGHARALMEDALEQVAVSEGLMPATRADRR